MKRILITSLLLWTLASRAQNCDCPKEFDYLVNKIERDYAGFTDKVNSSNAGDYRKFTSELRSRAQNTRTFHRCVLILDEWLGYFKDKHLSIETEKNIYFTYQRINDSATLLRIPNFSWENKEMIDSLILKNKKEITSLPILIIDLRGNG